MMAVLTVLPVSAQEFGHSEGWARRFAHEVMDNILGGHYDYGYHEYDYGDHVVHHDGWEWSNSVDSHSSRGHMPETYIGVNILSDDQPPHQAAGLPQKTGRGLEWGFSLEDYEARVCNHLYINTALYLSRSRYWLADGNYLTWDSDRNPVITDADYKDLQVRQGYLRYWSLKVPLMVEICSAGSNGAFLSFGPELEYRFGDVSKVKLSNGDKYKVTKDINLNPLALNGVAMVGVGNFGIRATYSVYSLFNDDSPVEAYPFMIGLSASF